MDRLRERARCYAGQEFRPDEPGAAAPDPFYFVFCVCVCFGKFDVFFLLNYETPFTYPNLW